jgi:uncharacterized protein YjbI with pentapeptide repeats
MADAEHLSVVANGKIAIDEWNRNHPRQSLDLSRANLTGAALVGVDLCRADLTEAYLREANLSQANLSGANLTRAHMFRVRLHRAELRGADLRYANLTGAELPCADLAGANLFMTTLIGADLRKAHLCGCDLAGATLVQANIDGARLTGSRIYGVSAWDLHGIPEEQSDLTITPYGDAAITVDNIKLAQFIYLLLDNPEIRSAIDTITSKVVLVLGRFSGERKPLLDALRSELRRRDRVPILFDFETPSSRDTVETVRTLASLARFVIADLTDAKSVLQELQAIVPEFPSLPVQPLLLASQSQPGMFDHIRNLGRDRILPTFEYTSSNEVIASMEGRVVAPAHSMSERLRAKN